MKKLLVTSFTICFIFLMCKKESATENIQSDQPTMSLSNFQHSIVANNTLEGAITQSEAKILIANFRDHMPDGEGAPVTKSVWFTANEIHTIDSLLQDEKKKGMGTDGLRVMFGKYPQTDPQGHSYEFPGQNTVIFVSTRAKTNSQGNRYHSNYFEHGSENLAFNRGDLCEPYCEGDEDELQ